MISREGFHTALTVSGSGCYRRWLFNTWRFFITKKLAVRAYGHLRDEIGA